MSKKVKLTNMDFKLSNTPAKKGSKAANYMLQSHAVGKVMMVVAEGQIPIAKKAAMFGANYAMGVKTFNKEVPNLVTSTAEFTMAAQDASTAADKFKKLLEALGPTGDWAKWANQTVKNPKQPNFQNLPVSNPSKEYVDLKEMVTNKAQWTHAAYGASSDASIASELLFSGIALSKPQEPTGGDITKKCILNAKIIPAMPPGVLIVRLAYYMPNEDGAAVTYGGHAVDPIYILSDEHFDSQAEAKVYLNALRIAKGLPKHPTPW